MRLLFLTPSAIFAGAERVTLSIAAAMRKRGHEAFYCSPEGPIQPFAAEAGVSFIPTPKFSPWAVRELVRKLKPDIIHAVDFRASLYAALCGPPFVAHLHNNPPWLRRPGLNSLATLFFGRRAAKILAVSKSVLEDYVFAASLAGKTLVLGNTVHVRAVRERSRNGAPEGAYDVGFMGRLVEQKRPLAFIDIVARLKGACPALRALMIGEGRLRPEVERAVAARGLAGRVTLAGFLPDPFPALARCKIVIMPSAWEGFGLAAVESLALGKPVLASPVGGLKDIVTENCGKLCATTAEFMEEALALLADEGLYAKKARAARERAEYYQDNSTYYNQLEGLYTSL